MANPGRFLDLLTDPLLHFTGALAQNAAEFEDIQLPGGIGEQPFWIQSIQIMSRQNLAWEFLFFSEEIAAVPTDPVGGLLRGRWSFQAADAVQVAGAGLWLYTIDGLLIPDFCKDYRDVATHGAQKRAKLHVALVNRSVVGKSAADPGAIAVNFTMTDGRGW